MSDLEYYVSQLNKTREELASIDYPNIQIRTSGGNTKWLGVNHDSLNALESFVNEMRFVLDNKEIKPCQET